MLSSQEIIKTISNDLEIKEKIEEFGIDHLLLVGSYSKNNQKESSDIDIVYTKKESNSFTLINKIELKNILEKKLNKKVDLVSYNNINPRIRKSLLSNQKQIV